MDKKEFNTLAKEVGAYWDDMMPMMAMEECGELIQAISKVMRVRKKFDEIDDERIIDPDEIKRLDDKRKQAEQNMVEEIGDVIIASMALMSNMYIKPERLDEYLKNKLNKKY